MRSVVRLALLVGCGRMPSEPPRAPSPTGAPAKPIANPNFGILGAANQDVSNEAPLGVAGDCVLIIENTDSWPVVVRVEGLTRYSIEVPAKGVRELRVPPGQYRYRAEAPALAAFDYELQVSPNMRYSIRVSTSWLTDDDLAFAGKGWHCAEFATTTPHTFACARTRPSCDELRAMIKSPSTECAERKVMFRFGHKGRRLYASSLADCAALRAQYLASVTLMKGDPDVTACEERH
jgi:hypothetical protein